MTDWQIDIAEDTVRHYSEHRFPGELHAAFAALMQDRADQVILLKAEHLDIGLPRRLLALQQRIRNSGGHSENR